MSRQPANGRMLALTLVIGASGLLLPWLSQSEHFNVGLYLIATTLITFDFADAAIRAWIGRRSPPLPPPPHGGWSASAGTRLGPYAIVVSVHDIKASADLLLDGLAPLKARTWFVDDCSTDDTDLYLRFRGWRCLSLPKNLKKPAALRELLKRLPAEIETVVVLDPDCVPLDCGQFGEPDLERVIRTFQASGAAACLPRIRYREDGPVVACQLLECEIVFSLGRKGMGRHCVASGVSIYDRTALGRSLDDHSLSVYAEDLENSVILLDRGGAIYHDDRLTVETEGRPTVAGLFSQRVGWSFGLLRVCASRWREILRIASQGPWPFYNFAIYMCFLGIALLPLRVAAIGVLAGSFLNALDELFGLGWIPDSDWTEPTYFSSVYFTCTALVSTIVAYLRPRVRVATLITAVVFYPFYAALNVVAAAAGLLNWISVAAFGRRIYRDHYVTDDAAVTTASAPARGPR
jgi:cellulose synthase/poly-beta-1,6-N-acetylglucosamine synthase-like glycosyltransferase